MGVENWNIGSKWAHVLLYYLENIAFRAITSVKLEGYQ